MRALRLPLNKIYGADPRGMTSQRPKQSEGAGAYIYLQKISTGEVTESKAPGPLEPAEPVCLQDVRNSGIIPHT